MGKIVLLDDLTINQIAAGEVIERPASAVKELVENSIDAGAKNITVDVKNGGISYIRVIDDGSGILPDDMEIAFERHATSKIRKADDLETVKSMGFRGEALASIAAIAKVELVSKTKDSTMGYKIVVEGGNIVDSHEEGTSKGTSITVKDLFYNTPVRYKFLRKDFTELGYIEDAITRIALANPGVAIKLINSGKTIIQTNGSGKIEDAIYAIYGKEIVENILPVDYTYEDMHITGVIGKPIISRSNRTNQLFFVNNRYIKDKTLTSAAEQGFKGLVTVGKHGFLILNIEMDMKKVDVNVHPTKLEVRFEEESKVFKAVYHAIKETLLKGDLVSDPEKDYSDLTPNDILKEVKNKDRVEAWGLNKTFQNSSREESKTETKKQDSKKEGNKEKSNNGDLNFSDFKNTIKDLDEETRTKFVKEIAKATTPEEIKKGLNNFTMFMMKKKDSSKDKAESKSELDNKEEKNKTDLEKIDSKEKLDKKADEELNKEDKDVKDDKELNVVNKELNKSNEELKVIDKKLNEYDEKKLNKEDSKELEKTEKEEDKNKKALENDEKKQKEELKEEKLESNDAEEKTEKLDLENEKDKKENVDAEETKTELRKIDLEALKNKENETKEDKVDDNAKEKNQIENKEELEKRNEEVKEIEENKDEQEEISFEEMYKKLFGRDIEDAKKQYQAKLAEEEKQYPISPIRDNEISIFESDGDDSKMPYKFIGIAFNTYIILSINNDLYILDQHAAHERIMYEKVKKNYYTERNKDSQLMLLPDIINLNNKEMGIFKDNKELFEKAGFMVEEFGDNTIKLTGVPEFCMDFDTKEIFLETLDEINTVARTAKQELEDKFLATVACKAAVKAHMALTKEEVDSLMQELLKLPNPFSCPHGRPTVIKMSKTDIEKKFSRR